jgi:uncharacterized protein with NAD-binding domain and iron-sulfur cluster
MGDQQKTKVAILGGGMAGLTTAFYLTATKELREQYDVTLYQMGWRLGGKCATGRGVFDRIEEHGIHAFVGSYYNALGMMSACYDELSGLVDAGKVEGVLPSFEEAFRPADSVVLWEWIDSRMRSWPFRVEGNNLSITTHAEFETSLSALKELMAGAITLGRLYYDDNIRAEADSAGIERAKEEYERRQKEAAANPGKPLKGIMGAARWVVEAAIVVYRVVAFLVPLLLWAFKRRREIGLFLRPMNRSGMPQSVMMTFASWLRKRGRIPQKAQSRRIRILVNYLCTICRGIFTPDYNLFKDGFDILESLNYIDWLRYYGLSGESESAPIAINNIDISYNFPDGDNSRPPSMAAGTYLRWTLRMLLNLQSYVWSFEAGTGETVIAPLYHVLKNRGVNFAFFHKVKGLELSPDRQSIEKIAFDVQAELKDGVSEYDPLVRVDCEPDKAVRFLMCWPGRPKYELLKDGDALRVSGKDLESYWTEPPDRDPVYLHAGADFDKVVFAIAVGAVPYLFPGMDIMGEKSPPDPNEPSQTKMWREMVAGTPACATQTLQVWFDDTSRDMGGAALDEEEPYGVVSGTFVAPFNGQADFSRLIGYERWGRGDWAKLTREEPKALWYFSGALTLSFPKPGDPAPSPRPTSPRFAAGETRAQVRPFSDLDFPREQNERVWDFSVQFLQATAGYLLPKAAIPWQPLGLDFGKLMGPDATPPSPGSPEAADRAALISEYDLIEGAKGTARLHNQFWKANIEPSERYTQCPPGGTTARLAADGSGFNNMVLAGDWIANRLNLGSVEGAVMGGKLASRAICGAPVLDDIVGYGVPATPATGAKVIQLLRAATPRSREERPAKRA